MQTVCMGCVQHGAQFVARAEAVIHLVVVYWPVAVVARELRVRLARVVLVAVLERVTSPGIGRVLCDRRYPDSGYTQVFKKSAVDLLRYTRQITALIIDYRQYLRIVQRLVVSRVAVVEPVDHQRVKHLRLVVVNRQLGCVSHHLAVLHRDKHVVQAALRISGIEADERTSFRTVGYMQRACCTLYLQHVGAEQLVVEICLYLVALSRQTERDRALGATGGQQACLERQIG